MATAAYVEPWDIVEFPSLKTREGFVPASIFREPVVLVLGPDPGDPTRPATEELVDLVLSGQARVANVIVRSRLAGNPVLVDQALEDWIEEARAEDEADENERQLWHRETSTTSGRGELYARAGLTHQQLLAMRAVFGDPPKSQREVAKEMGIGQSALNELLSRAKERVRKVASDIRPIRS